MLHTPYLGGNIHPIISTLRATKVEIFVEHTTHIPTILGVHTMWYVQTSCRPGRSGLQEYLRRWKSVNNVLVVDIISTLSSTVRAKYWTYVQYVTNRSCNLSNSIIAMTVSLLYIKHNKKIKSKSHK